MVRIQVLYFAQAGERTGIPGETLEFPPATDDQAIREFLVARHPALAGLLPHCRLAVDQAFATGPITWQAGSELAVIPPVSGG